jgi:hypothetical protein
MEAPRHIWLKQTVEFMVGQQKRTIEIGIPVRPGATREEIEQLLQEADAGMEQLAAHLQAQVRATLRGQAANVAHAPAEPVPPAERGRPVTPAEGTQPVAATPDRRQPAALASDVLPPESDGVGMSPAALSVATGNTLSRKQFIAEIAVLGLNPRQAMERLGVRSLDGVNLSEALEQLRRQLLHDRSSGPIVSPAHPIGAQQEKANASESGSTQAQGASREPAVGNRPPREETAPRLLHEVAQAPSTGETRQPSLRAPNVGRPTAAPRDVPTERAGPREMHEGGGGTSRSGGARYFDEEEMMEPPHTPTVGPRPLRPVPQEAEDVAPALPALAGIELVQARSQLNRLREISGGGPSPSQHQIRAFTNIVIGQLQPESTRALLRKIWRVTVPEKLTTDQIQALIEWGRQDEFEEEARRLLTLPES